MDSVRYQKKLSGPILDRIDLHLEVPRVDYEKLAGSETIQPAHLAEAIQYQPRGEA